MAKLNDIQVTVKYDQVLSKLMDFKPRGRYIIISDGTPHGSHLFDTAEKKEVEGVKILHWRIEAGGGLATCRIERIENLRGVAVIASANEPLGTKPLFQDEGTDKA